MLLLGLLCRSFFCSLKSHRKFTDCAFCMLCTIRYILYIVDIYHVHITSFRRSNKLSYIISRPLRYLDSEFSVLKRFVRRLQNVPLVIVQLIDVAAAAPAVELEYIAHVLHRVLAFDQGSDKRSDGPYNSLIQPKTIYHRQSDYIMVSLFFNISSKLPVIRTAARKLFLL